MAQKQASNFQKNQDQKIFGSIAKNLEQKQLSAFAIPMQTNNINIGRMRLQNKKITPYFVPANLKHVRNIQSIQCSSAISIPFNDDQDKNQSQNFFRRILNAITKSQNAQQHLQKKFKEFVQLEKQGIFAEQSVKIEKNEIEVIDTVAGTVALNIEDNQEITLLGMASMINDLMLDSVPAKQNQTLYLQQKYVQKQLQNQIQTISNSDTKMVQLSTQTDFSGLQKYKNLATVASLSYDQQKQLQKQKFIEIEAPSTKQIGNQTQGLQSNNNYMKKWEK